MLHFRTISVNETIGSKIFSFRSWDRLWLKYSLYRKYQLLIIVFKLWTVILIYICTRTWAFFTINCHEFPNCWAKGWNRIIDQFSKLSQIPPTHKRVCTTNILHLPNLLSCQPQSCSRLMAVPIYKRSTVPNLFWLLGLVILSKYGIWHHLNNILTLTTNVFVIKYLAFSL